MSNETTVSPPLVNAWIFLNEDQPEDTDYNTGKSYQRLISKEVYKSVDILFVCFFTVVRTGPNTIPPGNGSSCTLEVGNPDAKHSNSDLTNRDYLRNIVRDARKQNPQIRIIPTLDYGKDTSLAKIFSDPNNPTENEARMFTANLIQFLKYYGLQGLDIDWERPLSSNTSEKQLSLLSVWIQQGFRQNKFLLTISPAHDIDKLDPNIVNNFVDLVNLQLYYDRDLPKRFRDGVNKRNFAYGAEFEETSSGKEYQTAQEAFDDNNRNYHYGFFTCWRLNSRNYVVEQDEQVKLYKLVHKT